MATTLENLTTALASATAELAALTTVEPGWSADGYSAESRTAELRAHIEWLREQIATESPYIYSTRAVT